MKREKIKKSVLFYVSMYFILLILAKFILNLFNLEFLSWVYKLSYYLLNIGMVLGLLQIIKKSKLKKILKMIISSVFIVLYSGLFSYVTFVLFMYGFFPTEYSTYSSTGQEYLYDLPSNQAYIIRNESHFFHGTLKYYKYVNWVIRSNELVYEKDF